MDLDFSFNLRKTHTYRAVVWGKNPILRFAKQFKKLFFALFIVSLLMFLYGFLPENFPVELNKKWLGFTIISLVCCIVCWIKESFLNSKIKKIKPTIRIKEFSADKHNLADLLSFETATAASSSIRFAKSKKVYPISSSILFYFLLKENPNLNFIFSRVLLSSKEVKKILNEKIRSFKASKNEGEQFSLSLKNTILESLEIAKKKNHSKVEVLDVIPALAKYDKIFKKILIDANLKPEDIENLSVWQEHLEKEILDSKRFWEWKNLLKFGSLGKEWAAGFTVTLDKFSVDFSRLVQMKGFPKKIGQEKEIKAVERILSRREQNNVLMIGDPGSGRKTMVQEIARKSTLGESLPEVNYKRVVQLDLSLLLAQADSIETAANVLETIFNEVVTAGNIILVIDEFHNFVAGKARPGVINIAGVLSSYLNLPQFQIIAITTYPGLHKYIEQNPSILSFFTKVETPEISKKETLKLLEDLALQLEFKYKKFISYQALRDVIVLCDKYLADIPFPKKAIDLLDEIMVYVTQTKEKVVLPKHVAKIISDKTQIPVGELEAKERQTLLNLEDLIHQRIINQAEAVKEVSAALRRARAGVVIKKGPMGSFLFLGPTGVGKTETSKALAEIYFGSEDRMIRLDMSEFQNTSDIPRLIGSAGKEGLLTTKVRENPFSLILLDEIEKAHSNILNLFLQVLDEGHLTDGLGRRVDFKNTIIIATSNAGYLIILDAIKANKKMMQVKDELLDFLFQEGVFRPEFINRFDAVVLFRSLSKEDLLGIVGLLLNKLKKNLYQKDIDFIITEKLKERIVELGYSPRFGAREINRVIQSRIGDIMAKALLAERLKRGDRVEVNTETFKLRINP